MRKTIGIGVAGAGAIGIRGALSHLSLQDVKDYGVRLAAICDPVPGRAKAAAEKFGVTAYYESYEELLQDPNVDIVTLCTPIGLHYKQGVQAIEAGKHVHFNKTMTTRVEEADDIIRRAAENNIRVVASPGMMLRPENRKKRKLILEGELGQLGWAIAGTARGTVAFHFEEEFRTGENILTSVNPEWYFKKPGGGPMYDITSYMLHELTGILGPVQRVTALSGQAVPEVFYQGKRIAKEMDDSTILMLDFGSCLYAVVYTTIAGEITGWSPNIYGTHGALIGSKFGDTELKDPALTQPHVKGEHAHMREAHVFADIMQLVDWVRDGTPSIVTAEHARHVVDIIESGYRAAETGQTQQLCTTFEPLPLEQL
ncbi:Gfo/Idh/MocA family protein [Paenibacillus piri]|uniref:Gfo/Idh/MocA family oxidoreductase n=1 Tax=Paenibacillus piri TaxID=2547395 RepID=A0A4R5KHY2_9BACL|nr:Gfo/Idh/MocA family oxidoreductase [Paenibacillus piri]TDF95109.1 Gfo/Idh/MocA family oxidoreductase [Paenibacillus piri]